MFEVHLLTSQMRRVCTEGFSDGCLPGRSDFVTWRSRCDIDAKRATSVRALGRFLILRAHKFQTAALHFHPRPGFHRCLTPRKFYPFRPTLSGSRRTSRNFIERQTRRIPTVHPPQKRVLNSESARESWSEGQRNYATDVRIKWLRKALCAICECR